MLSVKYIFTVITVLFLLQPVFSQPLINVDSVKQVIDNKPTDTNTLRQYLKYIDTLSTTQTETIFTIAKWVIANAIKDNANIILADAYYIMGKTNLMVENFPDATKYYNQALLIAEKNNNYKMAVKSLIGLQSIFKTTNNIPKTIECIVQAKTIAQKNNYLWGIAQCNYYLGVTLPDVGFPKTKDTFLMRIKYIKNALDTFIILKDTPQINVAYVGLAERYSGYGYYDSAINILNSIAPFYLLPQNQKYLPTFYFISGITHYRKGRSENNKHVYFKEAIKYFNLCIPIAQLINDSRNLMRSYDWAAYAYEILGDYKNAFLYEKIYTNMADSIGSETNLKAMADIQNKYEREKKDREILQLNTVNQNKSTLNKIFIGSTITLFILALLGYKNFSNKQKLAQQQQQLQQQQITQLQKEKQLLAIDAMLKGQEDERSRIAKDLHDGLGGMLSGTKLSFMHMKENLVLTNENAILFDQSLKMLDNTMGDLRKVAHNLMPEALVKFGLQDALKDFCNGIKSASNLGINFQVVGDNRPLSNTADVFIYRIIQELVNNCIKHAQAKNIMVQLSYQPSTIGITVDDDGVGFDKNNVQTNKGAGMQNIQYRVDYFNGTIDIDSTNTKGTSFNIDLKV